MRSLASSISLPETKALFAPVAKKHRAKSVVEYLWSTILAHMTETKYIVITSFEFELNLEMLKITHEEHNREPSQAHPTHRRAGYSDGDKGISARFIKLVRRLELPCPNSSGSTDFALLPLGIYTISVCYLPELQG
jgi:hypothetical protein